MVDCYYKYLLESLTIELLLNIVIQANPRVPCRLHIPCKIILQESYQWHGSLLFPFSLFPSLTLMITSTPWYNLFPLSWFCLPSDSI